MARKPITQQGMDNLEVELKQLKTVERPQVIEQIAIARDHGDLKENAEYHAAREKQGFIEGRIAELESIQATSDVIDIRALSGSRVVFGAVVKIIDDDTEKEATYQLLSEYEADLEQGKISFTSPIAKALIGKEEGDMVEIITPSGSKHYEILDVTFG